MKQFGDKNEFGIEYKNYVDMFPSDPDVLLHPENYEMGGSIYFWVKGKNLFAFKGFGPDATYSADLSILLEFFTDKFTYLVNDDPFPIQISSTNAIDMLNETQLIEGDDDDITKFLQIDWDKVDMEVRGRRDRWIDNHGMLTNNHGTFLPNLYIRKVNDTIEISWDNKFPHRGEKGEVYLEYAKGAEYVDLKLFKNTVIEFCLDNINRLKKNHPEMNRFLENLKKAQAIEV